MNITNGFELELQRVQAECSEVDWDGYGAEDITDKTIDVVRQFIQALPDTITSVPDIVPEPTGNIGLEWRKGPDKTFVISLGHDHEVSYAGIFGSGQFVTGTSKLNNGVISNIVLVILQVYIGS